MYLAYAYAHDAWDEPVLIVLTTVIAFAMPFYTLLSNWVEERAGYWSGVVTVGRMARFASQFLFNVTVFAIATISDVLLPGAIDGVGGVVGAAFLTTCASQGAQYLGLFLFNRGYGDRYLNILFALSANIVVTALATAGIPVIKEAFIVMSLIFGVTVFGIGILSDLRAIFHPKRGIAVFFGTFNPIHKTHIELMRRALTERGVSKVIIHPTIIPKGHVDAFDSGEIHVARIENGMQVYETTEKADANINYFPTGNRFFAPDTRRQLIEIAIAESGLADQIEAAYMPENYNSKGFHGVLAEIKRQNPGQVIHGIHGSDLGGMMVRAILDECGWIYPMAVRRRDNVSATAIRSGARDMTTREVSRILDQLSAASAQIQTMFGRFENDNGILVPSK